MNFWPSTWNPARFPTPQQQHTKMQDDQRHYDEQSTTGTKQRERPSQGLYSYELHNGRALHNKRGRTDKYPCIQWKERWCMQGTERYTERCRGTLGDIRE